VEEYENVFIELEALHAGEDSEKKRLNLAEQLSRDLRILALKRSLLYPPEHNQFTISGPFFMPPSVSFKGWCVKRIPVC
jgi:hypothetical protein